MAKKAPAPVFGIGLFFGVLLGVILTLAFTTRDTSETYAEYQKRTRGGSGSARLPKDHPPREAPGGGGEAHGEGDGHDHGAAPKKSMGGGVEIPPIAKVHFMKKFVAALTSTPQNRQPATTYKPLLKQGMSVDCAGCHDSKDLNMEGMKKLDPGAPAVEKYRKDSRIMIPLMQNWVARLNKLHGDKLTQKVTCTTCHATDPRE